jgi:hypothetical protein
MNTIETTVQNRRIEFAAPAEIPDGTKVVVDVTPLLSGADEQEKRELIAWYSSPEFTRRLLEHMHKAKMKAIREAQELREQ